MSDQAPVRRPRLRVRSGWIVFAACAVCFAASWRFTGCSLPAFWARRSHLADIFARMIPPAWGYAAGILGPLWATIQMSVVGTVLGSALALCIAPLCAANLGAAKPVRIVLRALVQVLRSFPTLILALAATFVFGIGEFAGSVAITLYTFAIMCRLTYEDIENAGVRAWGALRSMGCGACAAYARSVVPEIASSYLANALYLLETNVRHSAILGYVGAGGIGLLLNEKISWKEYDKVGTILLVLFAAVCVIELLSSWLTALVKGERQAGAGVKRAIVAALAVLFLASAVTCAPPDFSRTSPGTLASMLGGIASPDLALMLAPGANGLGHLLVETLCIAFVGTVVGAVFSLPLAVLGSGRLMPRPVAVLFRTLVMAVRSIPFLIWGLIFIRVTGPGAFCGVLTMAVCSIGLLCKRFIEAIDTLDLHPAEALQSMGVNGPLRLRWAVLPQLVPALGSAILYRFDVNIREASVLGLVGAGGIGAPLIFAMNHYQWSTAGAIVIGLIVLVWCVDLLSSRLR